MEGHELVDALSRKGATREHEAGATLVEMLVALMLLAVGLLATAPLFVHALRENAGISDTTGAGAIAVERMEQLRQADYESAELTVGGSLTADAADHFDNSNPDYRVRWVVTAHASVARTKLVTVRAIARQVSIGQVKQVTLTGIRGE